MVAQILKRDGAEEFHFYNRTARNYKLLRLTTDYKLFSGAPRAALRAARGRSPIAKEMW